MENVLECKKLCKSFGKKQILKDVSFSIDSGDILAFIGPNGSGKTTTIKLILGLQKIDSGSVTINGYDITNDYVKAIAKVGSIVENPDSYMYLTGYQNLKLVANCYPNITPSRIMELVTYVGLEKSIHEKVSKYSLGMRQRLGIARALLNAPDLLILDEPTNGLDPEGIKDLRNLLKKLASDGIISFSTKPLKIVGGLGILTILISLIILIYSLISYFTGHSAQAGWTSLIVTVTLLSGVQLLSLWIISEYIGRIYDDTKKRPQYIIDKKINIEK